METVSSEVRGAGVIDRSDSARGFLDPGWPLVALALLLLMLVRACLAAAPAVAPPPAFDPVAAVRQDNDAALAALRALPTEPAAAEALAALNSAVINFATRQAHRTFFARPSLRLASPGWTVGAFS